MIRILVSRQSRYPADVKGLKVKIKEALAEYNVANAEISVTLVGVRKMKDLAKQYLGEDERARVHEVLSFPSSLERGPLRTSPSNVEFPAVGNLAQLGDIVICYPEARYMAMKRNRMVDEILGELAQHSTLHLLGIHHN